tara:strand:- start:497 stop:901 length:405 start_codon:yes stop_codon:yes gene_type:complete
MSFLDINHDGMQDMDLYEKRKIIVTAMIKAKAFSSNRIKSLIVIMSILTLASGFTLWVYTGFLLSTVISFITIPLFSLILINKVGKPLYFPFIEETVKDQESILGDMTHRNKIRKQRNLTLIIFIVLYIILING